MTYSKLFIIKEKFLPAIRKPRKLEKRLVYDETAYHPADDLCYCFGFSVSALSYGLINHLRGFSLIKLEIYLCLRTVVPNGDSNQTDSPRISGEDTSKTGCGLTFESNA